MSGCTPRPLAISFSSLLSTPYKWNLLLMATIWWTCPLLKDLACWIEQFWFVQNYIHVWWVFKLLMPLWSLTTHCPQGFNWKMRKRFVKVVEDSFGNAITWILAVGSMSCSKGSAKRIGLLECWKITRKGRATRIMVCGNLLTSTTQRLCPASTSTSVGQSRVYFLSDVYSSF